MNCNLLNLMLTYNNQTAHIYLIKHQAVICFYVNLFIIFKKRFFFILFNSLMIFEIGCNISKFEVIQRCSFKKNEYYSILFFQ